ncbi:CBS domain-containing protein [Egibacter rhizosphaerae]|nr:CBS domain-containing protein [Egibacter rhizosphaerae]
MRVREWMSPDPVAVSPTTPIGEARRLMRYYGVRHLPVVAEDGLIGIVSDRDVRIDDRALDEVAALERLGEAKGEDTGVEAVMTTRVHTIAPNEGLQAATRTMLSHRVSALPVVDEDRHLVGIVTTTDCLLGNLSTEEPLASEG